MCNDSHVELKPHSTALKSHNALQQHGEYIVSSVSVFVQVIKRTVSVDWDTPVVSVSVTVLGVFSLSDKILKM